MFTFGSKSKAELVDVHPRLVVCCQHALSISPVDFSVFDGLRTIQEQKEYVKTGVSRTMKSKHLRQDDGYGHAVDLVPYINGKNRWEWPPIYLIAEAMHEAAGDLAVDLIWGAVWDRPLRALTRASLEAEVEQYAARRKARGKKAFLDGPHFQLRSV